MRRPGRSIKEALDISFRPTCDDNLEPRSLSSRIDKSTQDVWTTVAVATFVECINHKDERILWLVRKFAGEVKEKRMLHRL